MTRRTAIHLLALSGAAWNAPAFGASQRENADPEDFERNAARAKRAGVTHVVITEDFPPSLWQFDTPGDPYPAWYIYQPGLFKIFPPAALQRYVNMDYAEKVAAIFQSRCEILRRAGLKAAYAANEPQVIAEAFFTDHPDLRGPRVDHPDRSRKARFSPCVDRPEVLALYRESMQQLLKRLPEVEIFSFLTSDSGSGLCWAPSLYPGANGPAFCRERSMQDRVTGFLSALNQAAKDSGHNIEVDLVEIAPRPWMLPTFDHPQSIARHLPAGMAVDHFEGPDGHRITTRRFSDAAGEFAPVLGIPRAAGWLRALSGGNVAAGSKLVISFDDPQNLDLSFRLLETVHNHALSTKFDTITALHGLAIEVAGKENADNQLELWLALDDAERYLNTLNFGPILTMGCILGRWITRPFVPFPADLTKEETSGYRPFLFQAKGEDEANDLVDIQGMRMYEGWGARLLVQNIIDKVTASTRQALLLTDKLQKGAAVGVLAQRIKVLQCFVRTAENAVKYQAGLDRAKALNAKVNPDPVLGARSGWDRQDLLTIARDEIDNAAELYELLQNAKAPLVDTAPTPSEETMRKLGPDLPAQVKRKVDVMNAHWEDYKKLFTSPNP